MERHLAPRLRVRALARAAMALVMSSWALPGIAAPDWDIVGLKLGMTEAEARAALQAYDPKGKIIANHSGFSYSDKVQQFKTPSFLNSIEVRVTRLSIEIPLKVWFSGPIGDVRVIAISRQEYNLPNPPTGEQFRQSLIAKYGPAKDFSNLKLPYWEEAGKPSCINTTNGPNFNEFSSVIIPPGKRDFSEAADALERRQRGDHGSMKGVGMPADLRSCGAFLYYTGTHNNPANHFMAGMFDVGGIIATHRSRNEWVDQLEADAIRKREAKGQGPRL